MNAFGAVRRRLGDDRGFTLVELLTTITLSGVIGSVVVGVVTVGMHQQVETQQRNLTLTAERTALQRIDRDLRGADPLLAASATSVTVAEDPAAGSSLTGRTVTYSVVTSGGASELVADETDTSSSGTTVLPRRVLLTDLVGSATPVFAFSERPSPYNPPSGVGPDCSVTASPGTFDTGCVGSITVSLSAEPSRLSAPVTVSDSGVELENAA